MKTPDYYEALDRVKIGEFIKRGIQLRGVVHIGANDGYEVQWYRKLALNVLLFEPLHDAIARFMERYPTSDPQVQLYRTAIGNIDGEVPIRVNLEDGGSGLLPEIIPSAMKGGETVSIRRFATWANHPSSMLGGYDSNLYNACVIDVQGMELDVLRGMDEHIQDFDCFVVECSSRPVYKGEASADEVVRFMEKNGFVAVSPICEHDDILFTKPGLIKDATVYSVSQPIPKGNKLNLGSGQRRFDPAFGWINVDSQEKWQPDVLCDIRNLSMFDDNSMDIVVLHQVVEHFGCGEASGTIRESLRVLKSGGSLIVSVPDMRALAKMWFSGELTEQVYMTNVYGAYMGNESDRHKWGYSPDSLWTYLKTFPFSDVHAFNWRSIPGADIARDDRWILCLEAVK